jgi:diguanylate cyclase (GGDEF)-like protein/PAS domain S-box-containing protein
MSYQKDFYKDIIDNLYDGVYFVDRDRVINYWNKGAERITGYTAGQTIGRSCRDNLLNHVTANGVLLCQDHCPLAAVMEDGQEREAEVYLHHADGYRLPVIIRGSALRDEAGNIIGAVESFSNNSSLIGTRRKLRDLRQAAMTDALTGIGNRRLLEGRLSATIAEFHSSTRPFGLLFVDVDRFKEFNDIYGHNTGDKVLRMVAQTARHALRATDTLGRWGGEEFIAILHDVRDENAVRLVAEKIRALVEQSHLDMDDEHSLSITVSIGGTLILPEDSFDSFIGRADQLMYRSKQAGRNRVTVG